MQDEVHKLREHLFECDKLAQRLSEGVSDGRIPPEFAAMVDAQRHSVLSAMRVAHALELATKLVAAREES